MYNMCAEHVATETGSGLLWHAVDGNGDALCERAFSAAPTPGGAGDYEGYCGRCMDAVAVAVRSHAAADPPAPVVGGHPHDH